jgi:hypothetical protein
MYSAVLSSLILLFISDMLYKLLFRISDLLFVGAWRSLVAHLLWEQGVGGSNPLAPTNLRLLFPAVFARDAPVVRP